MIEPPTLLSWLNGIDPLGHLIVEPRDVFKFGGERLFWLRIGKPIPAHTVHEERHLPLLQIPSEQLKYLYSALRLLDYHPSMKSHYLWEHISHEKRAYILQQLGPPPPPSRPIYFITTQANEQHEILYVGKTTNTNRRFSGGHLALTKLLNPTYDGQRKCIFFCEIHFGVPENYGTASIDFVTGAAVQNRFVVGIESLLINAYTPILNKIASNASRPPLPTKIDLTVQNDSGEDINIPIHNVNDEIIRRGRHLIGKGY
jgi:hypothetical protein